MTGDMFKKNVSYILIVTALMSLSFYLPASADLYIDASATINNGQDTVGQVQHFLQLGTRTSMFIAPFTIYIDLYPKTDTSFTAEFDFHELGRGRPDVGL